MSEKEKDQVLGHEFDGIEEYDNDLPRWWLNIFWITAVFAVVYVGYTHGGYVAPDDERLKNELAALEAMRAPAESEAEAAGDESAVPEGDMLLALVKDSAALAGGKTIFETKCAACHRPDGGGLVGPNLTDEYWLHGGKPENIKHVVLEGVPAKGMIPWKTQLNDTQVNQVVAYIISLKGSNPANPKEPQGEKEAS